MTHDSDPSEEFQARLRETGTKPHELTRLLDALTHEQRVVVVRSLGRADQRRLFEVVAGYRPLALRDIVPPSVDDMTSVRHFGKNTLPAFTHFEKRFCRPRGADRDNPGELFGFNFQSMQPVTGPGYFVAREDTQRREVLVDYTKLPSEHPDGWPAIRSNERGLSRFVYGFMVDTLRGVSEHVSIGSAARNGRDIGSWFALTRES